VNGFNVIPCHRNEIIQFIEKYHYSHNMNGVISDYCFKMVDKNNKIIGAMVYGKIAMADVWKKYHDNENTLIELRRLVLLDEAPKNSESYFISKTIKWLKNYTIIEKIISYADETYGHTGIIYKASNFLYLGKTASGKSILYNDKLYHDKTIRTKYNNELKPFAIEIKEALKNGTAKYIDTKEKNIYLYEIKRKGKKAKQVFEIKNYEQALLF
jgi:hypothetical protein